MKYPDSGAFLNSIAKRARKYYLGLTTITQDVEDFLSVDLGKAIIQNSSLQILLKQSTVAIDKVAEMFYLSEGEKQMLLASGVGEGLFFAGAAHAAIKIIASPQEHELVTTKPQEMQQRRDQQSVVVQAEPAAQPPPGINRPIFTTETVKTY
jgi:conjugal transfer ATP-binding protein TraC